MTAQVKVTTTGAALTFNVMAAAALLGVGRSTVRRRAGIMGLPKHGRDYVISAEAIEQMRAALADPTRRGPRAAGLRHPQRRRSPSPSAALAQAQE